MSRKNHNKLNDWEKVYQLPIHYDSYNYAWAKNGTMALMFNGVLSKDDRIKITDSLNGETNYKIDGLTVDGCDFSINGVYAFCVRGWGNLTGTGALNYSEEKATKIQDGFINYIKLKLQP